MPPKPWYKVISPREDLRENRPLDAAEFAVHLDQVRDGRAPGVYQDPQEFFARTYLTETLLKLSSQVTRRLAGEVTETSAVFNLATQFGGGKTHALTMLYHLARHGPRALDWTGVPRVLERAGVSALPESDVAVFVGTEFDALVGRGGDDGTPHRRTPWGEIAWQLGGEAAFGAVAEHDRTLTAPGGDVVRKILSTQRPSLILLDELMNYVGRSRKSGLSAQFYEFMQNLSEEARGRKDTVVAVSIPASEMEMTAEDQSDYERLKKLVDRLGKAMVLSSDQETAEIIRRRLFDWEPRAYTRMGDAMLPPDAYATCNAYAEWALAHRQSLPGWFPVDRGRDAFASTYPFHPSVLSVFERKWQSVPRFQRTRGVLRLLALWVARAYQDGYKKTRGDALLGLGSAPLEDPDFRTAMFEQLGEGRLEVAVTTDIAGKRESHAVRLDQEADETLRRARLHRKVASAILFESKGGQIKGEASLPEIRLAVGEPDLDLGNVEAALEGLTSSCYYLTARGTSYYFSVTPNLNKLLSDRRAGIRSDAVEERMREEVAKVVPAMPGVERVLFPDRSSQVPHLPAVTLVLMPPDRTRAEERETLALVEEWTHSYGTSGRTFKSALFWLVAESPSLMAEETRKLLAWEGIKQDVADLDDGQRRELEENLVRCRKLLKESVWRSYRHLYTLGRDGRLQHLDLGTGHSSAAESLTHFVIQRLRGQNEIETGVAPAFLLRHWPPALKEWSTRAVRDAFFSTPLFPRLIRGDAVRETIAKGVSEGHFAYVGVDSQGHYKPFLFATPMDSVDVELSEDLFLVTGESAEAWLRSQRRTPSVGESGTETLDGDGSGAVGTGGQITAGRTGTGTTVTVPFQPEDAPEEEVEVPVPQVRHAKVAWRGEVTPLKWTNFYTKVVGRFARSPGVRLTVHLEVEPPDGVTPEQLQEMRVSLEELGLRGDWEA